MIREPWDEDLDGSEPWPSFDHEAPRAGPKLIRARAFQWIEPSRIPPREWVLGRHLIRRYVSATVSPGGVGKSALVIAEGLAMASGRNLIGHEPQGTFCVWYCNLEDPEDELQRRVAAAMTHYGLSGEDIGSRLFVNSGRDAEIVVARQEKAGVVIAEPVVEALIETIRSNEIDVVVIDPFVSCHAVNENDNGAINAVATVWARIAEAANVAIELVHHARKMGANETTVEDARGASALISKARAARVLNLMTADEAARAGVENRKGYFRVDSGKANLAPASTDGSRWYRMESVSLGNGGGGNLDLGDSVGVVTAWEWPDPMADVSVADLRAAQAAVALGGPWRENVQAREWVGRPIAKVLKLDPEDKKDCEKVKRLLKVWIKNGMFVVVDGKDDKGKRRPYVEVGEVASD